MKEIVRCLDQGADVNSTAYCGRTPLWITVFFGATNSRDAVELLLNRGATLDAREDDGETALWRAISEGNRENVKLLLRRGADVNAKTTIGVSVLMRACEKPDAKLVEILLEKGADIEARDPDGETALWRAVTNGNAENVDVLLKRDAIVDTKLNDGTSILSRALAQNNSTVVKLLIEAGVDFETKDPAGVTPLGRALKNKNKEHANLLLERRAKITKSMLFAAAQLGIEKILKTLLSEDDVDIEFKDNDGLTVLWHVLASKNQSCIDLIMGHHPNINVQGKDGENMLHQAARFGNRNFVELLVSKDLFIGSLDPCKRTPLWLAVDSGDEDCVRLLLDPHADTNAQDSENVSIIHQAVRREHIHLVKLLLGMSTTNDQESESSATLRQGHDTEGDLSSPDQGATLKQASIIPFNHDKPDIDTTDINGESPLLSAVINESKEIVEILLAEGKVKFQGVDRDGDSELGRAVYHGYKEIVEALLGAGADIDKANSNGLTPLFWAAWHGHEEVAKMLLAKGCLMTTTEIYENTPLYTAAQYGHVSIVKLLLQTSEARKKQTKNIKSLKPGSIIHLDGKFKSSEKAMHVAASEGYEKVIKVLLDYNVNPSTPSQHGSTPLHIATEQNELTCWRLLLSRMDAAGIEAKNNDGNNVLHLACDVGNKAMVQDLLARISADYSLISRGIVTQTNRYNETPLSIAVRKRSVDVLQLLINMEADIELVDEDGGKWATMKDLNYDMAATGELLASEGALETKENREKTLNWGARNGDKCLVERVINFEFEVKDARQALELAGQALKWAAIGGKEEVIDFLFGRCRLDRSAAFAEELKKLAPVAVQSAARNGHERVVQQVIRWLTKEDKVYSRCEHCQQGPNDETWTPLHWAVNYKPSSDEKEDERQSMDIVRNMIMNGCSPNSTVGEGTSATKLAQHLTTGSGNRENSLSGKLLDLLESPLRAIRKPLPFENPKPSGGQNRVSTKFHANIVDFYTSGKDFCTLERKSPINRR